MVDNTRNCDFLIIGGGIAGLSAACSRQVIKERDRWN